MSFSLHHVAVNVAFNSVTIRQTM